MTDWFIAGAALGMLLMLALMSFAAYLRTKMLVQSAAGRNAVLLGSRFYYIVPAAKFVESSLNRPPETPWYEREHVQD
jgi:hypothetical protein